MVYLIHVIVSDPPVVVLLFSFSALLFFFSFFFLSIRYVVQILCQVYKILKESPSLMRLKVHTSYLLLKSKIFFLVVLLVRGADRATATPK